MEIAIHGTKNGYQILYKTSGLPASVTSDVRPAATRESAMGQEAYAIAYVAEGYVLSKYRIIRDVPRAKATGNIAVSVFFPFNRKLKGSDAKELLDNILDEYCTNYVVFNNLENVHEDWSFITKYQSRFESKIKNVEDPEAFLAGGGDSAYIYYDPELQELEKYLEMPFQEEYSNNKQVYLVDRKYEGRPENPLNALRHNPNNNLTGKIELNNPKYKLIIENNHGIAVNVKIDGKTRHNKVKGKEVLHIIYEKPYHRTLEISGRWEELKNSSPQAVLINDEKETVTIRTIELQPEERRIGVLVFDYNQKIISSSLITCKKAFSNEKKEIDGGFLVFKGNEFGEDWCLTINAEGYEILEEKFKPSDHNNNDVFKCTLKKQKEVIFKFIDYETHENISESKIRLRISYNGNIKNEGRINKEIFKDKDIDIEWILEISTDGYEPKRESIIPASLSAPLTIELKKKKEYKNDPVVTNYPIQNKKENNKEVYVKVVTGDQGKGKIINNGDDSLYGPVKEWKISNDKLPEDLNDKIEIKPRFGYKFDKWIKYHTPQEKDYSYRYEAHFKPVFWKKYLLLIIISVLIIGIGGAFAWKHFTPFGDNDEHAELYAEIKKYTEGLELNLDTLDRYKTDYGNLKIDKDSAIWNKILDAKKIRTSLIQGKIKDLKSYSYSEVQKDFKDAIAEIPDTLEEKIGDTLKINPEIKTLKLDAISDFIKRNLKLDIDKQPDLQSDGDAELTQEKKVDTKSKTEVKKNKESETVSEKKDSDTLLMEMNDYIKGKELDAAKLQDYKKRLKEIGSDNESLSQRLDNAIEFRVCLGKTKKDSYDALYKKAKGISKDDQWFVFLKQVLDTNEASKNVIEILNKIEGRSILPLSEIMNKYKEQKKQMQNK